MKIDLVYLHVLSKSSPDAKDPEYYAKYNQRFLSTYKRFAAGEKHTLRVVFCGRYPTAEEQRPYESLNDVEFMCYTGTGWDLGAHQAISVQLCCDAVLCLATPVYFWKAGWLRPLVSAWERYGDGLYGPMGSYENRPHIRTSAFMFSPETMRKYPWVVDSRETCFHFESGFTSTGKPHGNGERCFTNWMLSQGKPVLMVTWDKCYHLNDWRKPDNIFRRGDQSNCLVWDRHNDIYAAATDDQRRVLEQTTDTIRV